ncbi:MAG: hypothetical protein AB7O74_02660 [Candidatus Nanopelagicales bacterium]
MTAAPVGDRLPPVSGISPRDSVAEELLVAVPESAAVGRDVLRVDRGLPDVAVGLPDPGGVDVEEGLGEVGVGDADEVGVGLAGQKVAVGLAPGRSPSTSTVATALRDPPYATTRYSRAASAGMAAENVADPR